MENRAGTQLAEAQAPAPTSGPAPGASQEDVLAEVEAFLDKICAVSGGDQSSDTVPGATRGAEGGGADSLADMLGGIGLSQGGEGSGGSALGQEKRLPDNAPPCSDFVPKVGRDLEEQQEEHRREKKERQEALDKRLQSALGDEEAEDSDPGDADEEFTKHLDDVPDFSSLQRAQMNCPSLTELIFGKEEAAGAPGEITTDSLRELLQQILPPEGQTREKEGIPMPADDRPLLMDVANSLGPEKLRTLHEMLGLYDEEGRKRRGLFDK